MSIVHVASNATANVKNREFLQCNQRAQRRRQCGVYTSVRQVGTYTNDR